MAYVSQDGSVLQTEPWPRRLVSFFLGIFYMFFMFFKSFVSPVLNAVGTSEDSYNQGTYRRDYRPGSGPPRPPSRRLGRPNTGSSNIYTPGPCGGCGCG
ncbi:uncharacterized protein [Neodiprion pinetum]|uniref:Selenoprotein K-like n=1 Tax=Neodiprion lecontei TaxID=441921 RepID=A0A6J0C8L5_NEOLC|nr:selenoprotein K-like [Neodiprion lecontei]XP_046409715.1 selenoprotein K-like [Neodiprion fabricii]XP_046470744.1 selenoprotein K-like [Neodiprion pinetum]XP_046608536.1 selenoprotein K-like [Neodiprion virginianus]